jgi:peptidoglycan/LPS O-acetylase OafA/YrhL
MTRSNDIPPTPAPSGSAKSSARNVGLDLLRFVAIALVLGGHVVIPKEVRSPVFEAWNRGGWIGVDLFFVLSGFLVSGLLFKEHLRHGTIDVGRFLVRRGFKIYPAFWVMTLVTLAVYAVQNASLPARKLVGDVFFLQNYIGGLWNHTWSLAVEEHFYLAIAAWFFVLSRRKGADGKRFASVPYVIAGIAVVCLTLRIMTGLWLPKYSNPTHLFPTHLRADSLAFGVLLSYFVHYQSLGERLRRVPTLLFVVVGVILMLPAFRFPLAKTPWMSVYGVLLLYLGSGALVIAALRLHDTKLPLVRSMAAIGAVSYSIYLWHLMVNFWIAPTLLALLSIKSFHAYVALYFVLSLLLGFLGHRLIEAPALRFRDRWFGSRSAV